MQTAPKNARKTPICAAAPSSKLFGLESNGPKSVIAPMPKKIKDGYKPVFTPMYKISNKPPFAMI